MAIFKINYDYPLRTVTMLRKGKIICDHIINKIIKSKTSKFETPYPHMIITWESALYKSHFPYFKIKWIDKKIIIFHTRASLKEKRYFVG